MANPRKFSEKIALQKQKQAEGTAEFEKIMNEVKATRVVENALGNIDLTEDNGLYRNRNASVSGGSGGSGTSSGASGGGASPDANAGGGIAIAGGGGNDTGSGNPVSGSPTSYRESRGRSVGVGPMRRPSERKQDRSPYGSTASGLILGGITPHIQNSYLSPPIDSSWRRSNSDSALHQTLNNLTDGNYGASSPAPSIIDDLNSLHANYHNQHPLHSQRSQSPNIGRSYSPQAQRRKNTMLQQQQQQIHHQQQQHQQLQHQRLQMEQQQQQQRQQFQENLHNQQQAMHLQLLLQQEQHYANAKYNSSNIMFKSLQEQQLSFNNTGSLPDLTSLHYSTTNPNNSNSQMMQATTPQQQTLSPTLSPHHNNGCHDRDQTPSPFRPPSTAGGGNNAGGPPSPYHQQQNSPTSATNSSSANVQTSPHLSFTNLSVQSPVNVQQSPAQNTAAAFSTLPTLGAASSTGNLTDYRQPLNPPSPGSSPGLLTSGPANDIHTSAPPSPIRNCPSNLNASVTGGTSSQGQQSQNLTQSLQNSFGNLEPNTGYNTLNPAFHNHFEQFHLGDTNSRSPQNNYDSLEFDDLRMVNHNNFNSKLMDFGDMTTSSSSTSSNTTRTNPTITTSNPNNNNMPQPHHQRNNNNSQQFQHHQQQQLLNNNSRTRTTSVNTNTNGPSNSCGTNSTGLMNNNDRQQDILSGNSSPIPSPLPHCVPSPSSPLPIPMGAHSPSHRQQLSLSIQTSPHHSSIHSPHHSPSPLSVSSPGQSMMTTVPLPSPHNIQQQQQNHRNHINNQTTNHTHNNHHHQHQHQNQAHTPTTATNIPQIIFSDYSSSRDIFDSLDLDLGTIDGPGLQMLSDQNPIMIADPSIEDSFRRDLN